MSSAADEPVTLALAALRNSAPSSTELQDLLHQEKEVKARKRAVSKLIKKQKRKEKQLHKRMNTLEPKDILRFLAQKLSQPSADAADAA